MYAAELHRHNKRYTASYLTKPVFFKSRIPVIVRMISSFIPLPTKEYKNELIEEAKPSYLTWPIALGWAGLIAAVGGFVTVYIESQSHYGPDHSGEGLAFGLAGLARMGIAWWLSSRRPVYQAIAKQPLQTPRREFIVARRPVAPGEFHCLRLSATWSTGCPPAREAKLGFLQPR